MADGASSGDWVDAPRPELIDAIIQRESSRNPNAVSDKGAVGLMQIEPATAKDYGVTNPEDLKKPDVNRRVGTAYIADLIKQNGGDERKALIAYNQGPNRKGLAPGTAEYADAVLSRASGASSAATGASSGDWVDVPDPNAKLKAAADPGFLQQAWQGAKQGATDALTKIGPLGALGPLVGAAKRIYDAPSGQKGRAAVEEGTGAISMGGMMGGAMVGEMTPAGPAGAIAGAGAGYEAADVLNQQIKHYLLGDPVQSPLAPAPPPSDPNSIMGQLQNKMFSGPGGQAMQNVATGSLYEAIGRAGPAAMSRLFAVDSAAGAAREAAADQAAKNARELEAAGTGGEAALDKLRRDTANREAAAQQQAQARTSAEFSKINAEKAKAAKENVAAATTKAEEAFKATQKTARAELLGRTEDETKAALSPQGRVVTDPETGKQIVRPTQEELERKLSYPKSVFEQHDDIEASYGKEYNKFESNYSAKNIPTRSMDEEGRLNNVLKEIQARSPSSTSPVPLSDKLKALIKESNDTVAGKTYVEHTDPETGRSSIEETESLSGPTVKTMRELRRRAQRDAATLPTDYEKDIAQRIAGAADKSLEGADGVPKDAIDALRQTNTEYRDFKQHFDRQFMSKIANSTDPTDTFKEFFQEDNTRANRLLRVANPTQRQVYRNMFADGANMNNWSLKDIYNNVDHNVLRNLYGDKFEAALPHMEANFEKLKYKIANEPVAAREFNEAFQRHYNEVKQKQYDAVRDQLTRIANGMGKAGNPLREEIKNALDPQKMMGVAQKVANMSKVDYLKMVASEQTTPLASARQAVMSGKASKMLESLGRFARFRGLFYGAALTGGALAGHVSPTIEGLAAITALMGIPVVGSYTGRAILAHEGMADLIAGIATDPDKLGAVKQIARRTADAVAAMSAVKAQKQAERQERAETP